MSSYFSREDTSGYVGRTRCDNPAKSISSRLWIYLTSFFLPKSNFLKSVNSYSVYEEYMAQVLGLGTARFRYGMGRRE